MRARQVTFGIINASIFMIFGFFMVFLYGYAKITNDPFEYINYVLIAGIVFIVLFFLNLWFACRACVSKGALIGLLIFAIFGAMCGGLFGIFNIMSFAYASKYRNGEYIPSMREKRRMRREERREQKEFEKERMAADPAYRQFVHDLKKRKMQAIFKNFGLLALTALHSAPGLYLFVFLADKGVLVGINPFLLFIIVYVVGCPITLALKGVEPFFAYPYDEITTTTKYEYLYDDICGNPMYNVTTDSKTEHKVGGFFTIQGLLYYLVGWIAWVTQVIGLLISIFAKYNSRRIISGKSVNKIPEEFLTLGHGGSVFTYFLLTFVVVSDDYIDYLELGYYQNRGGRRRR